VNKNKSIGLSSFHNPKLYYISEAISVHLQTDIYFPQGT